MRRPAGDGSRTSAVPHEVEQVQKRFEEFRNTQPKRSRLPEPLWMAAAELAKRYGVHPTARALRLGLHGAEEAARRETPA